MHVLRTSNVPLSWMLVQGILFAGITMLVTARRGIQKLRSTENLGLLLVDLPAWTRKCSVCLALVNERWEEDLILKLDSQFEALADGTIKVIAREITSGQAGTSTADVGSAIEQTTQQPAATQLMGEPANPTSSVQFLENSAPAGSAFTEGFDPLSWGELDAFQDFLSLDTEQMFGDIFPPGLDLQDDLLPIPSL